MASYALARNQSKLNEIVRSLIMSVMMITPLTILVGVYSTMSNIHATSTYWGMVLVLSAFGLPLVIFLYTNFISSIPVALDEAAAIDGAGYYKIFRAIALPIARSGIILTFLFSFVWYWNETRQAGLYFGNTIKTLPMKLGSFAASYQTLYEASESASGVLTNINEAITLAGTMLSILPIMIMYIALQKQFVESIEKSGITGE